MGDIEAGDLVRIRDSGLEMLVIGCTDDAQQEPATVPSFFCVWEELNFLHEEVFSAEQLTVVRKEKRRVPRSGELCFPKK